MNIKELIKAGLISNDQRAIYDYKFQTNMRDAPWYEWLDTSGYFECRDEYLIAANNWIHSTKRNSITGLEDYKFRDMTSGTTQVFDEAYYMYATKRLRIFRGEYKYHNRVFNNIKFLDDVNGNLIELDENDWIVISNPFCGIGDQHPKMYDVLDIALQKHVPVIIDCAWFGTCRDIQFDFTHPAITQVCFSLSKGLGLGHLRSGIRYLKTDNNSVISQQNKYNHLILVTAQIGIHQMNTFSPDFITNKYYNAYLEICNKLSFVPTKCAHIAVPPDAGQWAEYINDNVYRKVGLRKLVKQYFNDSTIL